MAFAEFLYIILVLPYTQPFILLFRFGDHKDTRTMISHKNATITGGAAVAKKEENANLFFRYHKQTNYEHETAII